MANYLETYYRNYNPAYRNYTNSGGDCTNFASQALYAGGWQEVSGFYWSDNCWWYSDSNETRSWIGVEHWANFAGNSNRVTVLNNIWDLRLGDVLQVKPAGGTQKVHTMMVSYYSGGIPYLTYHTNDRLRRSLNDVITDWPGGTFYAYRT